MLIFLLKRWIIVENTWFDINFVFSFILIPTLMIKCFFVPLWWFNLFLLPLFGYYFIGFFTLLLLKWIVQKLVISKQIEKSCNYQNRPQPEISYFYSWIVSHQLLHTLSFLSGFTTRWNTGWITKTSLIILIGC